MEMDKKQVKWRPHTLFVELEQNPELITGEVERLSEMKLENFATMYISSMCTCRLTFDTKLILII